MSEAVSAVLERVYCTIQRERMADVPLLNPALDVKAVGFRPCGAGWIGILLTPWCMNLLLLPGRDDGSGLPTGQETFHHFAGVPYRFTVGEEPALGRFQSCSLFSPMFEFPDQSTAIAVAEKILATLFADLDELGEAGATRRLWLQGLWRPASPSPA